MPCYTVSTVSVAFPVQHYDVLARAVRALGGTLQRGNGQATVNLGGQTIIVKDGKAEVTTRNVANAQKLVNDLRVGYSQQVLKEAAQRANGLGWQATQVNPNQLNVKAKGR